MRNIKVDRSINKISLGTFTLDKRDIINIEKMILKRIKPKDFYITLGKDQWIGMTPYNKLTFSSIRYCPSRNIKFNRLTITAISPNFHMTFSPRSTTIYIRKDLYRGSSLRPLEAIAQEIQKYLKKAKPGRRFGPIKTNVILLIEAKQPSSQF